MTIDEIKSLDLEGIEARAAQIADEMTAEGADLDALNNEVNALEERKAVVIEERKAKVDAIKNGAGKEVEKMEARQEKTLAEVRASQEYINAYAEYIKSGDDAEVRSLLTDNVSGQTGTAGVPVPTYVEDRIRTAWDNDEIMSRVKRSNIAGNLKVGFELSADPAVEHTEGSGAIDEEKLALGIVELVPKTLKKFITISDEVLDMKGQAFLDYIFDEIEYRIIKLAADTVVAHRRTHYGYHISRKRGTGGDKRYQGYRKRNIQALRRGEKPRSHHQQGYIRILQGACYAG